MNRVKDCENRCQRPQGSICTSSCRIKEAEEEAHGIEQLAVIKQAIRDYNYALDLRKHAGIAQDQAFNTICTALDMNWQRGVEMARRDYQSVRG